jgi:hypothetical protein
MTSERQPGAGPGSACHAIRELPALGVLPAGDPRRAHLNACPRCRARLATYLEFVEAPPAVSGPQREEALARLGAALDREILGRARTTARSFPAHRRRPWLDGRALLGERGLPAGALAAAALLAVIGLTVLRVQERPPGVVLRAQHGRGGTELPETVAGHLEDDGSLLLRWRPVAGATAYRVELLDGELALLAAFEAGADTQRVIPADALRRAVHTAGSHAWTVTALVHGDVIARSRPAPLVIDRQSIAPPARGDTGGVAGSDHDAP